MDASPRRRRSVRARARRRRGCPRRCRRRSRLGRGTGRANRCPERLGTTRAVAAVSRRARGRARATGGEARSRARGNARASSTASRTRRGARTRACERRGESCDAVVKKCTFCSFALADPEVGHVRLDGAVRHRSSTRSCVLVIGAAFVESNSNFTKGSGVCSCTFFLLEAYRCYKMYKNRERTRLDRFAVDLVTRVESVCGDGTADAGRIKD